MAFVKYDARSVISLSQIREGRSAMPAFRFLTRSALFAAVCLGCAAPCLRAESIVTGNIATGVVPGALGNVGTVSVFAYSIQTAPAMMGPNQMKTSTVVRNGVTSHPNPGTVTTGRGSSISVTRSLGPGRGNVTNTYGPPTIAIRRAPKPVITGDEVQVISSSGLFGGSGLAVGPGANNTPPAGIGAAAFSFAARGDRGDAAGEAIDPVLILGGSEYDYAPEINITISIDDPEESGGVDYYATDSSIYSADLDDFIADPSESLWFLAVGDSASTGITEDFDLNPLAFSEITFPTSYLSSLSSNYLTLTTAQLAALIDAQIDGALSLALAAGDDSLSGFDPFSNGTTYEAAFSGGVEFADGVDAGLVAVPLPAAAPAGILLIALLAAYTCHSRRRVTNL
jgi:hypothetical protein